MAPMTAMALADSPDPSPAGATARHPARCVLAHLRPSKPAVAMWAHPRRSLSLADAMGCSAVAAKQ
eukprot:scaffold13373_cov102-Isochrysis_galbana.AAC.6